MRTRRTGGEKIAMRGRKMDEARTFSEKQPRSGQESLGSGGVTQEERST